MQNKEIITENELLELANRYIQLEQEHEELKLKYFEIIKENSKLIEDITWAKIETDYHKANEEHFNKCYIIVDNDLEELQNEINQLKTK